MNENDKECRSFCNNNNSISSQQFYHQQESQQSQEEISLELNYALNHYSLQFESCLQSIKDNSIQPSIKTMRIIFDSLKKEVSNDNFCLLADHFLNAILCIIKDCLESTDPTEKDKAVELLIFIDDLTQPHNYSGLVRIRAISLLFLSHYFRSTGDDHSAFQVLLQTLSLENIEVLLPLTHLNLATLYSKLNHKEEAKKYFKIAILAFEKQTQSLADTLRKGMPDRFRVQTYMYAQQNLAIALHNLGIEYEREGELESAFLAYFNSFMGARDHLGASHHLTIQFLTFLQNFVEKLEWSVNHVELLFEDPHSYQNIMRKSKNIQNPYFETFNVDKIKRIAQELMARVQNKQLIKRDSLQLGSINLGDSKNNFQKSDNHISQPAQESKSSLLQSPVKKRHNIQFADNLREQYHSILLPLEQYVPFRQKGNGEQAIFHEQIQNDKSLQFSQNSMHQEEQQDSLRITSNSSRINRRNQSDLSSSQSKIIQENHYNTRNSQPSNLIFRKVNLKQQVNLNKTKSPLESSDKADNTKVNEDSSLSTENSSSKQQQKNQDTIQHDSQLSQETNANQQVGIARNTQKIQQISNEQDHLKQQNQEKYDKNHTSQSLGQQFQQSEKKKLEKPTQQRKSSLQVIPTSDQPSANISSYQKQQISHGDSLQGRHSFRNTIQTSSSQFRLSQDKQLHINLQQINEIDSPMVNESQIIYNQDNNCKNNMKKLCLVSPKQGRKCNSNSSRFNNCTLSLEQNQFKSKQPYFQQSLQETLNNGTVPQLIGLNKTPGYLSNTPSSRRFLRPSSTNSASSIPISANRETNNNNNTNNPANGSSTNPMIQSFFTFLNQYESKSFKSSCLIKSAQQIKQNKSLKFQAPSTPQNAFYFQKNQQLSSQQQPQYLYPSQSPMSLTQRGSATTKNNYIRQTSMLSPSSFTQQVLLQSSFSTTAAGFAADEKQLPKQNYFSSFKKQNQLGNTTE